MTERLEDVTQEAVGDSARRRLRAWQPRAAAESAVVPGVDDPLALTPELQSLLDEIDGLRLSLSADLGLAASALEAGADDVARDVLAGSQDDLAVFSLRADLELRGPDRPRAPAAARRRGARRLGVLAPALTAAAALVGLLAGVVPSTPTAPDRSMVTSAAASYAELWRLHELGAPAPHLARAARQLHTEVARLVDLAAEDPATARQALRLLELELEVLQDPQHGGELAEELAESQRLVELLRRVVLAASDPELLADPPPAAPGVAPEDLTGPADRTTAAGSPPTAPADPSARTSTTANAPAAAPQQPPAAGRAEEAGPEPAPARPQQEQQQQTREEPTSEEPPPSAWFPTNGTNPVLPS